MKKYNKLVRDRIPELIRNQGEVPNIRILTDDEYAVCLKQKLDEEVFEYHEGQNLEELADILEVIYALTENLGCSREDLLAACEEKRKNRGGFQQRIFLISKQ